MPSKKKSGDHQAIARNSERHREVALAAAVEAERVLPLFEEHRANDPRPSLAIAAIRQWAKGERKLGMAEVRKLSLDAHAAARACEDDAAKLAARAAGHAVATWHVPTHWAGAQSYAAKAIVAERARGAQKAVSTHSK